MAVKSARNVTRTINEETIMGLIADAGIGADLLAKVPVNIEQIAYALGARVIKYQDLPVDGVLQPSGDGFSILLNKSHSKTRRRFSCAHEVAHAILDPKIPARRQLLTSRSSLEDYCEKVASVLLMPNPGFQKYLNTNGPTIQSIVRLAKIYLTSIQATAMRFVDVVEESCVLIISELRDDKTECTLKVRWSHQNKRKPNGKPLYFIPRNKPVNLHTSTIAYRTDQIQHDVEDIDIGTLKLQAYTESKGFGFGNSRFVLSLVFPGRSLY